MTERGLPIVDGAPACPFVAFEDDRDERAASPDHRHRCYAEAQPAPRALAHQEAYCLSSAFPVCPTFQDWARREAARSRGQERPEPSDSVAAAAIAPRRNPPRNWSEPPPWSSGGAQGERPNDADWQDDDFDAAGGAAAAGGGAAAAAGAAGSSDVDSQRGLSGSYADRVASDARGERVAREPDARDVDGEGDVFDVRDVRDVRDARDDRDTGDRRDERYGREDDDRDDGDREDDSPIGAVPPYAPPPARPEPQRPTGDPREFATDAWEEDDAAADATPEAPARRHRERDPERLAALRGEAPRAGGPQRGAPQAGGNRPVRRRDDDAPEWERARPLEAYPALRSRRLSELSIPPILVAVVALALAAAVLFALPGLLGFGKPSAGQSSGPSVPVTTPLTTPAPTPVPKPTDQLYVVQSGDTLSGIAKRFKVTLAELIAANAETLPDPNKLAIGDQLIIPAKNPDEVPAAS